MDKQILQERLDKLKSEQDRIKNMIMAYDGAIQECQYWLEQDVKDNAEQSS